MRRAKKLPRDWKSRGRIRRHAAVAREAGLTHALGRAVALENRIQMAGGGIMWEDAAVMLARFRTETARRWAAHYRAGGSLRNLGMSREVYRTREQICRRARRERVSDTVG